VRRKDLENMLRAVPFVPFRVVMADGRAYEVPHPHTVVLTRWRAVLSGPGPADPGSSTMPQILLLSRISRFEPAGQPAAGAGDGRGEDG
jgi:hypothetical protein